MKTEAGQIYIAHDEVKFLSEEECQTYELTHLSKGCWHLSDEELIQLIRILLNIEHSCPHEIRISLPPEAIHHLIAEHPIYFEAVVMENRISKFAGLFGGKNDFEVVDLSGAMIDRELQGGWLFSIRQVFEFLENECRLFVPAKDLIFNPDITPDLITIHHNLIEL